MKILVKVKTNAKKVGVERVGQEELPLPKGIDERSTLPEYKVSVKEAPVGGAANKAVIKALAEYFDVAPSRVTHISGKISKQKIFEIN